MHENRRLKVEYLREFNAEFKEGYICIAHESVAKEGLLDEIKQR
jgi:hypothetical protein